MSIYLDYAADRGMLPEALDAYVAQARRAGNPSSVHSAGQDARFAVESARAIVGASLGADAAEVIFTGGGTEAVNTAIKGLYWAGVAADPRRRVVIVPEAEHHATLDTAEWLEEAQSAEVVRVPVDAEGRIRLDLLRAALVENRGRVAVVTVMWANNEVGTIQPVADIARMCADAGVPLHVDAIGAYGQVPIAFREAGVAALSVAAHKVGGPVGIGALVLRRDVLPAPLLHGGGQERRVRSGTVDAPAAAAFAAAAGRLLVDDADALRRMRELRDLLIDRIPRVLPEARVMGDRGDDPRTPGRLPGNVHVLLPGCEGDSLVFLLDHAGFQVSSGSACTAGVTEPSHVLLAMGMSGADARSGLRVTLGRETTRGDVEGFLRALPDVWERAHMAGMAARVPRTF